MRALILAIKKGGQRAILKRIEPQIVASVNTFGAEAVIPMPPSYSGWVARGFSLPRAIAAHTGLKVLNVLELADKTSQAGLGAAARRRQRTFRFKVHPVARRLRAVLIDDVCATGTTLDSAIRCCRENGIELVGVFTLAKTTSHSAPLQSI